MRKRAGFTLIELMVVIFILALCVGMLTPRLEFSADQYLRREALRFRNVLQWATEQALYEQRKMILQIDFADNRYRLLSEIDGKTLAVNDSLVKERKLKASAGVLRWGFDDDPSASSTLSVVIGPWGPEEPIFLKFSDLDEQGGYRVIYTLMQFRPVIQPWSSSIGA